MEDVFGQAKLFRGGGGGFWEANNIETLSGWQIEQYCSGRFKPSQPLTMTCYVIMLIKFVFLSWLITTRVKRVRRSDGE